MLTNWGMAPKAVEGGPQALAALAGAPPAGEPFRLVLLDAMMPDMDGFMLAEQIYAAGRNLDGATLMMLSSAGPAPMPPGAGNCGIVRCLTKPVKQSDLLRRHHRRTCESARPTQPVPPAVPADRATDAARFGCSWPRTG